MRLLSCCMGLVLSVTAGVAHANMVAIWNMNDMAGGATTVTTHHATGTPTLTLFGGSVVAGGQAGTSFVDAESTSHVAGQAAAWDSGVNDGPPNGFIVNLNTIGFENLRLRADLRSTATGPPSFSFEYRVGGVGAFTPIASPTLSQDSSFHAWSYDLSSIGAIENAFDVDLRFTFTPGSGTGTMRVDNFELTSVPAPGAAVLAMIGMSMSGYVTRRRAHSSRMQRS